MERLTIGLLSILFGLYVLVLLILKTILLGILIIVRPIIYGISFGQILLVINLNTLILKEVFIDYITLVKKI